MKRIKKILVDGLLCYGLIFPYIHPEISFGEGVRICCVVMMGIVTTLVALFSMIIVLIRAQEKHCFNEKDFKDVDMWYRFYEPISDLCLVICLIVAGHPIMAGIYLFCGLLVREYKYLEIAEYEEKKWK